MQTFTAPSLEELNPLNKIPDSKNVEDWSVRGSKVMIATKRDRANDYNFPIAHRFIN